MKLLAREGDKSNRKQVDNEAPRSPVIQSHQIQQKYKEETKASPSYLCKNSLGEFLAVHWREG